jgi:hypothetical protein
VNGDFLPRNAGRGADFLSLSARLSRTFRLGERVRIETLVEGFNLLNRLNPVLLNGNFGSGTYPSQPLPAFRQVTAAGDPRSGQIGLRVTL